MLASNFIMLAFYVIYRPSKSRFSNYVNILIELSYIGLEMTAIFYINNSSLDTDSKLRYGTVMIAFSAAAILTVTIWLIWQFMLFMYDFKFVRDIIEETKIANQIHPEEDNLKLDLGGDGGFGKIDTNSQKESHSNKSSDEEEDDDVRRFNEDETVIGIEKGYDDIVNFDEKPINFMPVPEKGKKPKLDK